MLNNKICQYAIVASFVVCGFIQSKAVEEEFTLDQLYGKWHDIGRISKCENIIKKSCNFYDIDSDHDAQEDSQFLHAFVPIENIHNCEYGLPIYELFMPGTFINSTINLTGNEGKPRLWAAIKSYNNGQDLILTDVETDSCPDRTYRLWSRNRQASPETKAEFDKLSGIGTATYYSWDLCPKLRTKTDKEFTVQQLKGIWYTIAKISYDDSDEETCVVNEVKVDYEDQTFNFTIYRMMNDVPSKSVYRGAIVNSKLLITSTDDYDDESDEFSVIRCNNGRNLILRENDIPTYILLSRRPKVSKKMEREFGRVFKNVKDTYLSIYSQDIC